MKNAESSNTSETYYLERWFIGNRDSMQEFHKNYSRKAIIAPKVPQDTMKEEKLAEVKEVLKFQRLEKLLKLSGNVYPYLVKVFLTNIWYDEDTIYSQVKGFDIC